MSAAADPPGELAAMAAQPCAAVVGARRASDYGAEIARGLGRGLGAAGVPVVSGMALGVDSAAHDGALAAGGRTVAVLAGGVDVAYPRAKRGLHACIVGGGGVAVSEMPPGTAPRRWGFPARNRIIAALASVTVVVEAASRSGALITARVAREIGRDVGAVPGQVTSSLAAGTNDLIRDGAHVVARPQDVLDVMFGVGARRIPAREPAALDPRLRAALDGVGEGRGTVGELAAATGDPDQAMAALAELELRGLVRRGTGGRYVVVA